MPLKKCLYDRVLDSTKFSDETYILISRMYQVLIDGTFDEPHIQGLDLRTRLSYILGITPHASQRAIAIANDKPEGSVSRPVGRPRKSLSTEYSSAVTKIVKDNNQIGYPNTVKAIKVALKDTYFFDVSYQTLLRHLHELNMRYKKGERRNIRHDAPENVGYRYTYCNQRLLNLNGSDQPECPEVFLDESYCHLDHHTNKTWTTVGGIVNEIGRRPMMVIFAAFIVFKQNRRCNAKMIEDSVTVWPVNGGKEINPDYHGHFDAAKFEGLFRKLCKSLEPYGKCIIHMDSASYHKRRINPVPKANDSKETIKQWLINKAHLLPDQEGNLPKMTKAALLETVKGLNVTPVYACWDIARDFGHKIAITPPYHCELQPIEKVWSMVKNPIAFHPDLKETAKTLKRKLDDGLKRVPENHLLKVWKGCIVQARAYHEDFLKLNESEEPLEEIHDFEMTSS